MHSLTTAESWSSAALWDRLVASREIGAAITSVEDAAGALVRIATEAAWQSQAVRALHDLLVEFQEETDVLMGELHVRAWEIERAAAA